MGDQAGAQYGMPELVYVKAECRRLVKLVEQLRAELKEARDAASRSDRPIT